MQLKHRSFSPRAAAELVRAGHPPLIARLLAARGVGPGEEGQPLEPLETMANCLEAGRLLADAVQDGRRVLIVADYDADGATACAVGFRFLSEAGANVGYLIPNRIEHGYGLTPEIVQIAAQQMPRPELIVTVDNGISSVAGVEEALRLGIEVLVTDHHLAPEVLPRARLIVNPNQPACQFASKNLAGVGVMWYVCVATEQELLRRGHPIINDEFTAQSLLPLVALGTVADVVKLDANNRELVRRGLAMIRTRNCPVGIIALAQAAERKIERLSTSDIGFGIGPRINAAGRLQSMNTGVACLVTDDLKQAEALATQLSEINSQRKEIEASTVEQAISALLDSIDGARYSVALLDASWHQGVVGIVAGRVRETVHRPTFVFAPGNGGEAKGSGRSIPGLHLRDALDLVDKRCPGLLLKFGGHAMAAGVTIEERRFPEFQEHFEAVCRSLLNEDLLRRELEVDGSLAPIEMTPSLAQRLSQFVWGQGCPEPLFDDVFDVRDHKFVGADKNHLSLTLHKDGRGYQAIQFRTTVKLVPSRVRVAFRLAADEWRGEVRLKLMIEHLEDAAIEHQAAA